jgi:hypothetical protein
MLSGPTDNILKLTMERLVMIRRSPGGQSGLRFVAGVFKESRFIGAAESGRELFGRECDWRHPFPHVGDGMLVGHVAAGVKADFENRLCHYTDARTAQPDVAGGGRNRSSGPTAVPAGEGIAADTMFLSLSHMVRLRAMCDFSIGNTTVTGPILNPPSSLR